MSFTLPDDLQKALRTFAAQEKVLVCLDFDGCVAELVADAYSAVPVPANGEAIDRIAELNDPRIILAYVSGRPISDLQRQAAPPEGTVLIGSHGAEKYLGPDSPGLQLTHAEEASRQEIISVLEGIADQHEGVWVEYKPAGAALHVRHVREESLQDAVLNEARAALTLVDGAHQKEGKKILEAVVRKSTKGEAIEELRADLQPDAVFFAGDDVTDETGFAVLAGDDVSVKVGDGETGARFRIPEPASLAEVLNAFADAR
ncbi:trehalose-phosphatase [Nesterenkonia populi]|uniref:trehalose-phosphatase n=1 Tax=Nesterenkonia populi TaxID=1591087 RepID=UPI00147890D9|nr:trehalose-phosphatase [Nesterenkonia populi]